LKIALVANLPLVRDSISVALVCSCLEPFQLLSFKLTVLPNIIHVSPAFRGPQRFHPINARRHIQDMYVLLYKISRWPVSPLLRNTQPDIKKWKTANLMPVLHYIWQ